MSRWLTANAPHMTVRSVVAITVVVILQIGALPGWAQGPALDPPVVLDVETKTAVEFPRGITFTVDLGTILTDAGSRVELHYTVAGNETEHLVFVPESARSGGSAPSIELLVDLQSQFVPSGVELGFHWEVHNESDEIGRTNPESVTWSDTRWTWETTTTDQVRVHSYDLSPGFVRSILDSAQSTVTDLEVRFALERSQPIDIWVYASVEDLRGAQQPNSRESIAGASYPGYFLIVAVLTDGNTREVGRVVPHEISHQVLYQATRNPFTSPPVWFDEGLATHYQIGGTDGYLATVIAAHEQGRLFDLQSLDTTFPFLPAQATLAYASSWSAIEFIQERFGDAGIERLISAFATGAPFDDAIINALGISEIDLNDLWQQWVAQQPGRMNQSTPVPDQIRSIAA